MGKKLNITQEQGNSIRIEIKKCKIVAKISEFYKNWKGSSTNTNKDQNQLKLQLSLQLKNSRMQFKVQL